MDRGGRDPVESIAPMVPLLPRGPRVSAERIFIELMTSDRKLKGSREGSK